MLTLLIADRAKAEIVSNIIRASFRNQAEQLGISESNNPNYVAFETTGAVEKAIDNGETVILALIEDKPVGTVRYNIDKANSKKGYINRLAVLPEHRGKNYGGMLMDYAEEQLQKAGAEFIIISVVASFTKLKEFYEKRGYAGRHLKSVPSLPFEVLYMEKQVRPPSPTK